ncbi:sugar kinase [Paenibacillus marchantiophytorum]|uniref:Sugar kinase n=1 Tax=Paenibacillus marchantiophytorum TaxID=1619310 RepID=A0ABQ1EQS5_9BACL|nr:sugar kinase [Paenibacillus marchantiophytorum]
MSRAELAQRSKLSPTTVSSLVDELIQKGLIDEVGEKSSPGAGRRAIALEISRDKGYIISIMLGNNRFCGAIVNFRNEIVYEFTQEVCKGNDQVLHFIKEAVNRLLESKVVKDAQHVKGIAVSTPGIIDELGETIIKSTWLRISDLDVRKMLRREFDYPVLVVNDMKAAAFAEYYCGSKRSDNLVFLSLDAGIGMGLIIDGKVYNGYKGSAGEIGHIFVEPDGLLCECGQIGCIETILTETSILMKAQNVARKNNAERIPQSFDELLKMYEDGETFAEEVIDRTCFLFVHTLLSVVVGFISPEVVVLYGWMNRSEKFMKDLKKRLLQFPFPVPFDESRIFYATYGEKNFIIGASTMMLHKVFEDYI